jgi:hypothetical protein
MRIWPPRSRGGQVARRLAVAFPAAAAAAGEKGECEAVAKVVEHGLCDRDVDEHVVEVRHARLTRGGYGRAGMEITPPCPAPASCQRRPGPLAA